MSHLTDSSSGITTLSDRRDPRAKASSVPGGYIEDVDVTYDESSATAVRDSELEDWIRASDSQQLNGVLSAVQRQIERQFGLALVPQTVTTIVRGPTKEVKLPRVPENSLTSVKELEDGTPQDDESGEYYTLGGSLLANTGSAIGSGRIEVVYDAGYSSVPHDLKLALKRRVADHFDKRSDTQVDVSLEQMPHDATEIFRRYANS